MHGWGRTVGALAALAAAVALAGCEPFRAYPGPARPAEEVAVLTRAYARIESFWTFGCFQVHVRDVDGRGAPLWNLPIEMLPGRHQIIFHYGYNAMAVFCPRENRWGSVTFSAEPGHRYELVATVRDRQLYAWVIDTAMDIVVAGQQPPSK